MNIATWISWIAQNEPPGAGGSEGTASTSQGTEGAGGAAGAAGGQAPDMTFLWMMMLLFVFMYFILIRPQNKQRRELEQKVKGLKKGDRIVFSGGILGEVLDLGEKDNVVSVKIAEGVKVNIQRSAISGVLER